MYRSNVEGKLGGKITETKENDRVEEEKNKTMVLRVGG